MTEIEVKFENNRKPGRKKNSNNVAIQLLNFRVTKKEKEVIDRAATESGTNRSDFVREAIMFYIESNEKKLSKNV